MKATMYLILIILSLFSFNTQAQTLNLTIPSQKDFCVKEPDVCKRISEYKNSTLLPKFDFRENTQPKDKFIFYTLHVIDAWSTERAISKGYGKEWNPLLPVYPNRDRVWAHKFITISLYEYAQWLDDRSFIITMNYVTSIAVVNNLDIIIDNEF